MLVTYHSILTARGVSALVLRSHLHYLLKHTGIDSSCLVLVNKLSALHVPLNLCDNQHQSQV